MNTTSANVVVTVYKKDLKTVLATKTLNVNTTYGYKTVTFDTPVTDNDTMLVTFAMATVADSFQMAKSHNQYNGSKLGTANVFTTALPFVGDAAILAMPVNLAGAPLGTIQSGFDFFVIPSFTYKFKADYTPSKTVINRTETVTFTKKNDSHLQNPILNYIKWDQLANNKSFAYATINFGDTTDIDFDTVSVDHKFNKKGVFTVKQKAFLVTWTTGDFLQDSSEVTITVNSALSLEDVNIKGLNIYPNPVANELNVSFNANSAATIELVNVAGQVVASKKANEFANVTFNTSSLNAGVYFVNIHVAEGTFTQKIIKE